MLTIRVVFSSNIIIPKETQSEINQLKGFVLVFGDNVFCAEGRAFFCNL